MPSRLMFLYELNAAYNTMAGNIKWKHQSAQMAVVVKEQEQELRKQWVESAMNQRAAANKYGF